MDYLKKMVKRRMGAGSYMSTEEETAFNLWQKRQESQRRATAFYESHQRHADSMAVDEGLERTG